MSRLENFPIIRGLLLAFTLGATLTGCASDGRLDLKKLDFSRLQFKQPDWMRWERDKQASPQQHRLHKIRRRRENQPQPPLPPPKKFPPLPQHLLQTLSRQRRLISFPPPPDQGAYPGLNRVGRRRRRQEPRRWLPAKLLQRK